MNTNRQTFKRVIENNIWIFRFIFKYAPVLIIDQLVRIPVSILNTYISVNFTRWVIERVEEKKELNEIITFIIAICAFIIISNLIFSISSIILSPQAQVTLGSKIREDLINKVIKIDQIDFQNSDFFNIYKLGLNEIDSRAYQVLTSWTSIITSILTFILISNISIGISGWFSLFGVIAAFIDVILGAVRNKYNYKQTIATTPDGRKRGYINRLTYQPEFSSDLKTYTDFPNLLIHKYKIATGSVKKILLNFSKKILLIDQCQQPIGTVFRKMLPWIWIAVLLANGNITVAEATVLASIALTLPSSMVTLLNSLNSLHVHSLHVENLRKIFDYKEKIECNKDKQLESDVPLNLRLRNASFSYNKKIKAIDDVSIEIQNGEKIAFVGYNGAGKSTLVKLLLRLYDVDEGQLLVNEEEIGSFDVKSVRSRIAYISQDFKIYSFTVAENILMRPVETEADIEIVKNALQKVGLYDKIASWPSGVNTYITREFESGGEYLSGGEAQKLAIARIYVGNYDCIILDEPTSALDPISEDEILNIIFEIFKEKTLIIISHRLVTTKYVDRIYFLYKGKIMECGTHQELMLNGGEYSKFYSTQSNKFQL